MNRDGSSAHLIKRLEPMILSAAWSPDGKAIAVQAQLSTLGTHVYLMPPDGQGELQLLFPYIAAQPTWSPDRKRLLYSACRPIPPANLPSNTDKSCPDWRPWVASADGTNAVPLGDLGRRAYDYAWSPKGSQIAFAGEIKIGDSQLFVMNADGSQVRQLTHDSDWESCRHPSWSPDTERIAFSCTSRTARCQQPFLDNGAPINPWCVRRLFVVTASDPPDRLRPLMDTYGENPAFAPK